MSKQKLKWYAVGLIQPYPEEDEVEIRAINKKEAKKIAEKENPDMEVDFVEEINDE